MPKQILLADDSQTIAKMVQITFAIGDYAVQVVQTAAELAAHVKNAWPDVVLLDVGLPDKSGYDVCAELRRHGCSAPILMLTSHFTRYDEELGKKVGADGGLDKPFETQQLIDKVEKLLSEPASSAARLNTLPMPVVPPPSSPAVAPPAPSPAVIAPLAPPTVSLSAMVPPKPAAPVPASPPAQTPEISLGSIAAFKLAQQAPMPPREPRATRMGMPTLNVPDPQVSAPPSAATVAAKEPPAKAPTPVVVPAKTPPVAAPPLKDPLAATPPLHKVPPKAPPRPLTYQAPPAAASPFIISSSDNEHLADTQPFGAARTTPRGSDNEHLAETLPFGPARTTPRGVAAAPSLRHPSTRHQQTPISAPRVAQLTSTAITPTSTASMPPAVTPRSVMAVPLVGSRPADVPPLTADLHEPARAQGIPVIVPKMPRPSLIPGVPVSVSSIALALQAVDLSDTLKRTPAALKEEESPKEDVAPKKLSINEPPKEVAPAPEPAPLVSAVMDRLAAKGPEYEAIAKLSREVIEKIAWEVVPELAEVIIRAELAKERQRS